MAEEETENDVYENTCDEIKKSSPIVIDDVVDKNSCMEVQQFVWNLPSQINGNAVIGQSAVTTPTIKTFRSMATHTEPKMFLPTQTSIKIKQEGIMLVRHLEDHNYAQGHQNNPFQGDEEKQNNGSKKMSGFGKSYYQMLEPVKEQLQINEEENEIVGNTADAVYCYDGASSYSTQKSVDDLGSDGDDLNNLMKKNYCF